MNVVVFEDQQVASLHPISLGRPAYAISCGSYRLIDWLNQLELSIRGLVRPHLAGIQRVDYPMLDFTENPLAGPCLLVNARLVPSQPAYQQLAALIAAAETRVAWHGETIAAAMLTADVDIQPPARIVDLDDCLTRIRKSMLPEHDQPLRLFDFPHDVIRYNTEILVPNLEYRLAGGSYSEVRDGVFAAAGASLGEYSITDTSSGPILLEPEATTGPFCLLRGPAYLGHRAKLNEHAAIKDGVSIGHTTKTGGEVEAAIIEPYSNKQHHGFLGHSYIGSWVNLGAGTCNSDLKNTYGKVNVEYRGQKVATGMQFVGCVMGDYSKTAINTGIFTGKIIGVCSMLYGFVTTNVPSFVNYARLFGQVSELPPEVMVATQERMFNRRKVAQRPCDVQLIRDMYNLTRDERQLAGEPLTL